MAELQLVPTLSSQSVQEGFGVCSHPTFRNDVYRDVDRWVAALAAMGVSYFRGVFSAENPGCIEAIAACRKYGVKWLMLPIPERDTPTPAAEIVRRVRDVARLAADVCIGLEGPNEPNHSRHGAPISPNWPVEVTLQMKVLAQTARSIPELAHLPLVGPSLHAQVSRKARGRDYAAMKAAGVLDWQTHAGLHCYSGGRPMAEHFEEHAGNIRRAYGADYPCWVTETAYHNALQTTGGHHPITEEGAAIYTKSGILDFAARGARAIWYELLDDPDAGPLDEQESNFGLLRVDWSEKPAVQEIRELMELLRDPGEPYTPEPVEMGLEARSPVRLVVTRKRDGSSIAHLWRPDWIWEPNQRQPLVVEPTQVLLTDLQGERAFEVGPRVVHVELRPALPPPPPTPPCTARLVLAGQGFPCDVKTSDKGNHVGWPHGSTAAQAVWGGSQELVDKGRA